jgi:hypothetical protein
VGGYSACLRGYGARCARSRLSLLSGDMKN